MLQTGEDFTLPLIHFDQSKKLISVKGVALFDNEKRKASCMVKTRSCSPSWTENGQVCQLHKKVRSDMKSKENNYITIQVTDVKRDIEILNPDHRNLTYSLKFEFNTSVIEYPKDNLDTDKN